MIADIDASNEPSLHIHAKLGIAKVTHFAEVGWQFHRRLNLVFMLRVFHNRV